ncbi:hypothetical protein BH24BAC1_BH24BAC1_15410 [soil metagenome]|jgi:hypothetical protein
MKNLGIILIVIGLLLGIFGFYQSSQDNKLLEIGDLEVKKESGLQLNWMIIGGGILFIAGIVAAATQRR